MTPQRAKVLQDSVKRREGHGHVAVPVQDLENLLAWWTHVQETISLGQT